MAARDDFYRNQKTLDVIFALSCLGMLACLLWMFYKDHYREFKKVQRRAADVEVAQLRRQAAELKNRYETDVEHARAVVEEELAKHGLRLPSGTTDDNFAERAKNLAQAQLKEPSRMDLVQAETHLAALKATRDEVQSQRDQLYHERAFAAMATRERQLVELRKQIDETQERIEELTRSVAEREKERGERFASLVEAADALDKLERERARRVKLAGEKEIGWGAKFRALPIIDAFNSPYRIKQTNPEGLTIDYNFKQVQRSDRCLTCHLFSDRLGYDKDALRKLGEEPPEGAGADAVVHLKPSEIAAFANHPRLDLFVGSSSPHPVEKFGCTICHSGQGGSATFNFAYHSPDGGKTDGRNPESYREKRDRWEREHHWHADLHPDFLWDFPMTPMRFIESSYTKCHYEVTDLIRTDGKDEAPKLLHGYRLVRDLGCFGCHEINGWKGGRRIGPDMRLEGYPPVTELAPLERTKLEADPSTAPGNLRKVGPGLRRIAEKTNPDWTLRWIRSPRSFRPDTRMPHFFGLSNNTPDALSDTIDNGYSQLDKSQATFPDAEIQAMTFYLFKASALHLDWLKALHDPAKAGDLSQQRRLLESLQKMEAAQANGDKPFAAHPDAALPLALPAATLVQKLAANPELLPKLTKEQAAAATAYLRDAERYRAQSAPLALLPDPAELKSGDDKAGELLFQKRGCTACHSHEAVKVYDADGEQIANQQYGPNLLGLKDKLGMGAEAAKDAAARKWLFYWLGEPTFYHSRTYMPNPQLTPKERADLVAWLLGGSGNVNPPAAWNDVHVGTGDFKGLTRTYLEKAFGKSTADEALEFGGLKDVEFLRPEADERILAAPEAQPEGSPFRDWSADDRIKFYLGKKTIGRYGCFACHDVPGFDNAKPIGTPLNDWGKKDPERLAFDNVMRFIDDHLIRVRDLDALRRTTNPDTGEPYLTAEGYEEEKDRRYDPFFHDALAAHRREGFIYQKLLEPRSFDYGKMKDRPWDDRLKMPQFKFSHVQPRRGEDPNSEAFKERARRAEAEGREAVATFILSLVAEPVPLQFIHNPKPDRLNEVRGIKVLEKFNCVGCHVLKSGSFEYPADALVGIDLTAAQSLANSVKRKQDELERDLGYPDHNAWHNFLHPPAGKVVVRGLPNLTMGFTGDEEFRNLSLELWEAIKVTHDGKSHTFPAGLDPVQVPLDAVTRSHPPYGGTFTEILARTLARLENKSLVGDRPYLMGSVPPPLMREGQKVQPAWLYDFLRQPYGMRPTVRQNLLMPKFSLSHEDIEELLKYFVAVDRLLNPALGVEYQEPKPRLQNPAYLEELRAAYRNLLKARHPNEDVAKADYFESGWSIMASKTYCLNCHTIGQYKAEGKPEENGPSLHWTPERLRPSYVERWLSFPKRLVPYTAMQHYDPFYANGMPPPPANPPPDAPPPPKVDKNLSPRERVWAVRDALMSWGFLPDPPPTAAKAGPRVDTTATPAAKPPGETKP